MEKYYEAVNELFLCKCYSSEHQMIMSYFPDECSVYVSIHLVPEHNIWKRIKNGIKYIFGYRCKYGHFEEFIFNSSDADRLQKIVNVLNRNNECVDQSNS